MSNYKTPGVYVEEISKFPPSVAQVETAIPAFIGYTEKAEKDNDLTALIDIPTRIRSLEEYRYLFGGAPKPDTISVKGGFVNNVFKPVGASINVIYKMFNALELFFSNGGGPCYIVSVGPYEDTPSLSRSELSAGLSALRKYDEPTLLVIPDAVNLGDSDYGTLMGECLTQCSDLQDRFTVMDVIHSDEQSVASALSGTYTISNAFRGLVSSSYLKYGAAYYPFVKSFMTLNYSHEDISFTDGGAAVTLTGLVSGGDTKAEWDATVSALEATKTIRTNVNAAADAEGFRSSYDAAMAVANDTTKLSSSASLIRTRAVGLLNLLSPSAATPINPTSTLGKKILGLTDENSDLRSIIESLVAFDVQHPSKLGAFTISTAGSDPADPEPSDFTNPGDIPAVDYIWDHDFNGTNFTGAPNYRLYELGDLTALTNIYTGTTNAATRLTAAKPYFDSLATRMESIMNSIASAAQDNVDSEEENLKNTSVYSSVLATVSGTPIEMPPSGAVAGIYADVDAKRGVWKAPANVVVKNILGPSVKVDDKDQENLNVDANTGKSINAIRAFTGKGTLVWGARTLAGNDNEWRYIPVRRFYNMVEESVKKATAWAVFEPNDLNLWVKLKGMIDNFLTVLWRQGALAGSTPEEAFFVNVGLDETMTTQDILEGRLIVEIGMAAVRPAEFIILKFSHKMQEA